MNEKLRQQAEQYLKQGDFAAALTSYQQLLTTTPGDAEILHIIGMLQARLGSPADALATVNQAIELKPNFAPFYNSKGNVLLRLQRIDDAVIAYQQAVKIQPDYAIGYNSLGRAFYQQDKFVAAQKAYAKAVELNPHLSDAHYNYGVLLAKLGENTQAIAELNTALNLTPHNAATHGQLAQIYLQQQNYSLAIEHLLQRLKLQPQHEESYFNLGLAYLENDHAEEAATTLEELLTINSQHPEVHHYLGTAYLLMGDREKALNYFLRQVMTQPMAPSYYNIGVLLMYQERHKEAIAYLQQAAALEPGYLPTHLNLGALYLKLRATPQAIEHYQLAAKIKPDDAEIQHILTALTQADTPEKAPAEYLQHLFDQYAQHYDKHLTQYLHYKVPQQLHKKIYEEYTPTSKSWSILDLGCGTGLCGELFAEFAKKLIGIDISAQMIVTAKQKHIYDELIVADITEGLDQYQTQEIDLVLAADVFTYIGDLSVIFRKVFSALRPGGLFGFSVEKGGDQPYQLQQTIRYAHSRKYLESLITEHQFITQNLDNIILRKQKQENVEGYLVILQKPISTPLQTT